MTPDPVQRVAPARDDACLRSAEQLVAAEADDVGAGGDALGHDRLVAQRLGQVRTIGPPEPAAAEIFGDGHREPLAERSELTYRRPLGKAENPEVGRMHAQDEGRALAD